MCVGLVTHFAQIWLIRRVHMHVFLSVAAVCKPSVTAFKLALERLLSCRNQKKEEERVRSCEERERQRNKDLCVFILCVK